MKNRLLLLLIFLGVVSSLFYFSWWFEQERIENPFLLICFVLALVYTLLQVFALWYIYWHIKRPDSLQAQPGLKADVFIPTYDEPLWLVERTLSAAVAITYPHQTYLIDDGNNPQYRQLSEKLGTRYLTRGNNNDHKAGNINFALSHSDGDFIAIFDIDHVPKADFLDRSLGYFRDAKIGFVQVMLSHYNQSESFVAAADAQRNDGFFGPPMLGLFGCDCVQAFGSNCVFRRKALESVGGYQPGLAEDLNTSVHLHAKGWRSYYVPEVLAEGLEPADLVSFFKQQFKWARGLLDILWKIYPRLVNKLSLKKNICYLWRFTCYLAGPAIAVHIFATIFTLFQTSEIVTASFVDYLKHWTPLVVIFMAISHFAEKNYRVAPPSPAFPLGGLFLAVGSWPVYTLAFLTSLLGIKVPFVATPKEARGGNFLKLVLPQIITVVLLISGMVWRALHGLDPAAAAILVFALLHIFLHSGIFYAVYEGWRISSRARTNHSQARSAIHVVQERSETP